MSEINWCLRVSTRRQKVSARLIVRTYCHASHSASKQHLVSLGRPTNYYLKVCSFLCPPCQRGWRRTLRLVGGIQSAETIWNPSTAFRGPPPFDKGGKGTGCGANTMHQTPIYRSQKASNSNIKRLKIQSLFLVRSVFLIY